MLELLIEMESVVGVGTSWWSCHLRWSLIGVGNCAGVARWSSLPLEMDHFIKRLQWNEGIVSTCVFKKAARQQHKDEWVHYLVTDDKWYIIINLCRLIAKKGYPFRLYYRSEGLILYKFVWNGWLLASSRLAQNCVRRCPGFLCRILHKNPGLDIMEFWPIISALSSPGAGAKPYY